MPRIQYTIRRVSPALDAELRREASETGKTLNALVVQTLENAKLASTASEHDDLDWFIGRMPAGAGDEAGAQAWLDALPVEPAA
ncbi:MAG TPA: toxin-antitoxin system HicB family antitoxin [Solirubrobacteraceae bacterium]|nr:toxin-antitoxin system HicB family antitoxin [Solirubrobacteraceae bacterium]